MFRKLTKKPAHLLYPPGNGRIHLLCGSGFCPGRYYFFEEDREMEIWHLYTAEEARTGKTVSRGEKIPDR
jgi:hypothetical protein